MAIEKTINIKVNTGDSEAQLKKVAKATDDVNEKSKETDNTLDKLSGGAITKFKAMFTGLKQMAVGFKSVGVAIAASGIGLLVLTIAAVTSAFSASEEGQNKFAKLMGVIGSVTGNLMDLLSDFGELVISVFENPKRAINDFANLIKENIINRFNGLLELIPRLGQAIGLLFEGKFKEASKVAIDAAGKVTLGVESITDATQKAINKTTKFINELQREAKIAAEIANNRSKADKIELNLIVQKAEADRKIAELREIASRTDLYNNEQRKKALIEAQKINDEITYKEIRAAKLRRDAIIEENKLSKSNKDALKAEEEAKAAVIVLETQRLQLQKRLGTELASINNQASAEAKALAAERLKIREEEIKTFEKEAIVLETFSTTEKEKTRIALEESMKRSLQISSDEVALSALRKKLSEEDAETEQALSDAKVSIVQNTLGLIGEIVKEGSDIGRGIAATQATISGIEGVQNAYTTAQKSPITTLFPAYPLVQAGLAGAFSAIQIQKILSTKSAKSGGASVSGPGSRGASAPSFNLVQGTGSNQIAQTLANQNEPLKAYVVSSEVSTAQGLDRNIIAGASIG